MTQGSFILINKYSNHINININQHGLNIFRLIPLFILTLSWIFILIMSILLFGVSFFYLKIALILLFVFANTWFAKQLYEQLHHYFAGVKIIVSDDKYKICQEIFNYQYRVFEGQTQELRSLSCVNDGMGYYLSKDPEKFNISVQTVDKSFVIGRSLRESECEQIITEIYDWLNNKKIMQ
jgi:hypothetical protein